jgi:predicted nucleotidyltransferase
MLLQKEIENIKNIIVNKFQPDKIILFGSYANGLQNKNSDLDILIIKDMKQPRYQRSREVRKLLREFCFPMDILIYTNSEFEKWRDVKNSFVYQVLQNGKIIYG